MGWHSNTEVERTFCEALKDYLVWMSGLLMFLAYPFDEPLNHPKAAIGLAMYFESTLRFMAMGIAKDYAKDAELSDIAAAKIIIESKLFEKSDTLYKKFLDSTKAVLGDDDFYDLCYFLSTSAGHKFMQYENATLSYRANIIKKTLLDEDFLKELRTNFLETVKHAKESADVFNYALNLESTSLTVAPWHNGYFFMAQVFYFLEDLIIPTLSYQKLNRLELQRMKSFALLIDRLRVDVEFFRVNPFALHPANTEKLVYNVCSENLQEIGKMMTDFYDILNYSVYPLMKKYQKAYDLLSLCAYTLSDEKIFLDALKITKEDLLKWTV